MHTPTAAERANEEMASFSSHDRVMVASAGARSGPLWMFLGGGTCKIGNEASLNRKTTPFILFGY